MEVFWSIIDVLVGAVVGWMCGSYTARHEKDRRFMSALEAKEHAKKWFAEERKKRMVE